MKNSWLRALLIVFSLSLTTGSMPAQAFDFDKFKTRLDKLKKKTEKLKEQKKSLDLATGNVKQKDEIEIGRNVISGLLGGAPLVDNKILQRYVNKVGMWIAQHSSRPDLPWTFGVIDSPHVNAFAAPGGYIVLTMGLYELLENESQLAGVLAHEISHVIEKHHLDAIRDSTKAELLGELAVRATDRKHREKMAKLVNAGVQIYARGLDQRYEFGSDRMGVVLAARSGYDPYALMDVLATLNSISPNEQEMAVFLNTHPPLTDRLSVLEKAMDRHMARVRVPAGNQRLQNTNRQIAETMNK